MKTQIFDILVKAVTPISHNGGEKNGNMGLFRTETKFCKDDQGNFRPFMCPVVSSNSLRSILRKAASSLFLDSMGNKESPLRVKVDVAAMLFSGGGQVNKKKDHTGDVDFFKNLRKNMPPLSLFGTSKGNTMIQGKACVYQMIPIGKETLNLMPEEIIEKATDHFGDNVIDTSVISYIKTIFNTTKDYKNELSLKKYLEKMTDEEKKESLLMLYYSELLAAGTPIYWRCVLNDPTEQEYNLFVSSLMSMKGKAIIGGKNNNGRGHIDYVSIIARDIEKQGDELKIQSYAEEFKASLDKGSIKEFIEIV